MDEKELERQVIRIVAESVERPESARPVNRQTRLLGEGMGVDSVEILGLVTALETAFGIEIDDEDLALDMFRSVETVLALVRARLVETER